MLNEFPIVRGAYVRDLFAQPKALADTLRGLEALAPPVDAMVRSRIVLTGMGSSLHALNPLLISLIRSGRTAMIVETAELIYSQAELLTDQSLVIVVSQSGRSAETIALLDRIAHSPTRPFVIGVTNSADSPLATRSNFVVPLRAGEESTVSCKTYLATLAALDWLGAAVLGDDLRATLSSLAAAPALVEAYLAAANDHVRELLPYAQGLRYLFLVGRGSSLAAVMTGALILKESTRFHAEGMSAPAFRHGPLEMAGPGLLAIVFAGASATLGLNERLRNDIAVTGAMAAMVGETSSVNAFRLPTSTDSVRRILEMLPVQMMSIALAVAAGREPGVFERATKITATQ